MPKNKVDVEQNLAIAIKVKKANNNKEVEDNGSEYSNN